MTLSLGTKLALPILGLLWLTVGAYWFVIASTNFGVIRCLRYQGQT